MQECKKYDKNKGIHREERKDEKGHKMGFIALLLYCFIALCGRLKNIFIVLKLRFIQIFQRKRNYFVQINFVEKNYLYTTASGNSLRRCYKVIAGGVVVPFRFVAYLQ